MLTPFCLARSAYRCLCIAFMLASTPTNIPPLRAAFCKIFCLARRQLKTEPQKVQLYLLQSRWETLLPTCPEVLEKPYDERSDVWSAGCIALEMATCGIYDKGQMSSKLFEIKSNPAALEETLEEVKKVCSCSFSFYMFVCFARSAVHFTPYLAGLSSMMLIWAAGARCKWRAYLHYT